MTHIRRLKWITEMAGQIGEEYGHEMSTKRNSSPFSIESLLLASLIIDGECDRNTMVALVCKTKNDENAHPPPPNQKRKEEHPPTKEDGSKGKQNHQIW